MYLCMHDISTFYLVFLYAKISYQSALYIFYRVFINLPRKEGNENKPTLTFSQATTTYRDYFSPN